MSGPAGPLAGLSAAAMKEIGLVFFFAFFAVVVLRVVLTRRDAYDEAARIPLDDGPVADGAPASGASGGRRMGA